MGACGCGDFEARWKLRGPDGTWYAIQVYGPCSYCETGVAVIVYHFDDAEAEVWDVQNLPDLPLLPVSGDEDAVNAEAFIRIADPGGLKDYLVDESEATQALAAACSAAIPRVGPLPDADEKEGE